MAKSISQSQRAWKRFLRNKPAVIGGIFILLAMIIAILGYHLAPDSTPDANDQVLQINNQPPGYKQLYLLKTKNRVIEKQGFFGKMLFGQENPAELIPITKWHIEGDRMLVSVYRGKDLTPEEKSFYLADVAFPLVAEQEPQQLADGKIAFETAEGKAHEYRQEELSKLAEKQLITRTHWFGTDRFGRDILSRIIIGFRVSLSVGLVAVLISLLIGVTLGAMAGYFRGRTDDVIMWVVNVIWSIPFLLLIFAIMLVLGRGFWQIFIAVGLGMWVEVARLVRGQVLGIRQLQYVEAAKTLGFGHFRTIFRHILPNVTGPVIVISAANFASAILIEAGLSFIGIGVQPPKPSWGVMLNENYGFIVGSNPLLALIPGFAIMLMVLAFNLVGNGLRDALDVRTGGRKS